MGLASAHPVIATITAIATALGVVAVAYDHFHVSATESAKALSDMQSEYDGNKSELESLNSELETTQRRMDELQAKGHLTLTEQDELTKLQAQNSELERTIALKEAQQKIDAKKLVSQAQDTYESWTNKQDFFGNNISETSYDKKLIQEYKNSISSMGYSSQDRLNAIKNNANKSFWQMKDSEGWSLDYINIKENADNINYLIGAYETLKDAQKNVTAELDIIAAKGNNATEEELNQATALQEYYDEVEQKTIDVQDAMNNYADVISDTYNAYKEAESLGVITAKQSEQLKSMESFMTEYMKTITNTAGNTETAINNLFAESRFINLKDQLVSAGKVSEDVLAEVIAKTSGLPEALDKAGVSAQQLSDYIMAIADPDSLRIDVIKDWLRDQFTKEKYEIHFKAGETADVILSDLFKDKTDEEIEIFYKYVFSNNLDMSGWTKEDLKANWAKAIEENNLTVEVPVTPTFSSLFKDADGNDTDFSKTVDNFQEDISSIQESLDTLKEGEEINLTDVIQQFPSLAKSFDTTAKNFTKSQSDALSSALTDIEYYKSELQAATDLGIDLSKTVYDNVDTNNRQILQWTEENLNTYKDALMSWNDGSTWEDVKSSFENTFSTVYGRADSFTIDGQEVEIAYTPILQTKDGAKLLDANTVSEYIYGLIDKATENGDWSKEELLSLDAEGLEFDGQIIQGLLADIGDTAIQTDKAMHFVGKDGSIASTYADIAEKAKEAGISVDEFIQASEQMSQQGKTLEQSLNGLKYDKIKEFANTWQTEISKITDPDQLKAANQFFNNLLRDIDLSDLDIKLSEVSSNLLSNVTSTLERSEISNTLNKVWTEFGDTVEGREIIAKLSLNTDAANWTYEEWVEQIESEEIKADLRLSEESIADLQKQLEMKQSEASVTQSEIDLKNAAGYRTTEEDYKTLIKNGKEQIAIQDDIIKKRKKEQDNIKKVAQSTEQATAKYNELQKEIDSATSTLNDAYKSQIEWNTALDNLPITNAQSLSSAISSAMSEIDSSTGLTVDTVAALKEQFSELANIDVEDALYRTADGLKVDTNELERFTEAQNDAVMSQFESKIEAQRKAIEVYKATIGDNTTDSKLIKMQDDLESLLNRQAQYFAEYKNQMEQFTDYEDVQRAKNTENAGSHYDTMLSDLKTAKESYDKGLIGTDDFKSVAKYISPNGFDDFTNFAENYSKASRYLTEDSSGVINFLNDLQAKGYAAYQTLDDGSNQWIINIQDFADAAKDIGIGTDFFTDMFGKLEDYNIPNTFVSSVTEGELKIDDLTKQLVDAKVKLAELKAEGADTAVIDSQQRVVDELSTNLTNTQQSMNMFVESTKQNYVEGFSQVKDVISQLNDFRKNAQSEEEAQGYLNKIQEYADKYHLKLTADFEVDEASYQEQMDKMYVKSGSFENPIDPGFEKGSADAENYRSVLESVTKAHSENNRVLDESIKTLSKYDTETLKGINLNDGQYSVGLEDAERALDSLAQELGLTEEQAQMLATVLGSLGQTRGEVNVDYVDVTRAIDNLEQMQELGKIDETIDFTVDLSELDSNELESYLEKLKDVQVKLELDPDTEEYDYIVQRIQDTEIQMIIKEVIENGSTVEELLNMSDEDLAKTCNIDLNDDGASERLEAIKENLQEVNNGADVPITIRMDDTQFNQLLSDKNNDTATITVDADNEPAKEKINEAKDYADDQTGTMNIDGDKTLAINEANSAVGEINRKIATISIDGNLSLLSRKLTEELSKTRTINVSAKVSGLPKQLYTGTLLSPARVSGTAYNVLNYKNAYANGKVALSQDEEALVNELGTKCAAIYFYIENLLNCWNYLRAL